MITITYNNEIKRKTPEELYNLFLNLTPMQHRQMHPGHHKEWKLIKQTPSGVGSVFYGHEEFEKYTLKGTTVVVEARPYELIMYKSKQKLIPVYMYFSFELTNVGARLISSVKIGYTGRLGKLLDWFVKKFYVTDQFLKAHKKHVDEEFKYLETM